jgi:hypothetical protein
MDGNLEILQSMFERYFASEENPSTFGLNIVGLDDIPQKILVDLTFKKASLIFAVKIPATLNQVGIASKKSHIKIT